MTKHGTIQAEAIDFHNREFGVSPSKKIEDFKVHRGGTVTFKNECEEYEDFEVHLKSLEPADLKVEGTRHGDKKQPVKLKFPNSDFKVMYAVSYKHKHDEKSSPKDGEFKMAVSCGPCK
jgi:hypothetical protein